MNIIKIIENELSPNKQPTNMNKLQLFACDT